MKKLYVGIDLGIKDQQFEKQPICANFQENFGQFFLGEPMIPMIKVLDYG